jgi:hypothetical protein
VTAIIQEEAQKALAHVQEMDVQAINLRKPFGG